MSTLNRRPRGNCKWRKGNKSLIFTLLEKPIFVPKDPYMVPYPTGIYNGCPFAGTPGRKTIVEPKDKNDLAV